MAKIVISTVRVKLGSCLFVFFLYINISFSIFVEELEPRNIIKGHVTLSGFETGGLMAQTIQIAHSSFFQGVGIFSSTFYRCGKISKDAQSFTKECTKAAKDDNSYDPDLVDKEIQDYASRGLIDDPKNLANKRFYIYAGLRSEKFSLAQSLSSIRLWEKYIKNPYKIKTKVQDGGFVMPTDKRFFGDNCTSDAKANHFIANCKFSGAFEAVKFLLADQVTIHHPPQRKKSPFFIQPLRSFNQSMFLEGIDNHMMDEVGYYYVPTHCKLESYGCLLHVFFHGCDNSRNKSGQNFVGHSGFLELAERNDIVVLFPQSNPCWDYHGATGDLYGTKKGPQVNAVWRIIQGIITGPAVIPKSPKILKVIRVKHNHRQHQPFN